MGGVRDCVRGTVPGMKLRRPDGFDLAVIVILLAVFPPLGLAFGLDGFGTRGGAVGGLLFGLGLAAASALMSLSRPRGSRPRTASGHIRVSAFPSAAVRLHSHRRDLRWTGPGPGPV